MTNKEIKVTTLCDLRTYIMISLLNKLIDEGFLPKIGEETFDRILPELKRLYDEKTDIYESTYYLLREYGYVGCMDYAVKIIFSSLKSLSIIDVDNSEEAINAIKEYEMLRVMEYDGGGEGGAEDCYSIIRVGKRYFRCDYEYYSYEGFNYTDESEVYEVVPKKVEVIQYVALQENSN